VPKKTAAVYHKVFVHRNYGSKYSFLEAKGPECEVASHFLTVLKT
jgi:hypothetical protein